MSKLTNSKEDQINISPTVSREVGLKLATTNKGEITII